MKFSCTGLYSSALLRWYRFLTTTRLLLLFGFRRFRSQFWASPFRGRGFTCSPCAHAQSWDFSLLLLTSCSRYPDTHSSSKEMSAKGKLLWIFRRANVGRGTGQCIFEKIKDLGWPQGSGKWYQALASETHMCNLSSFHGPVFHFSQSSSSWLPAAVDLAIDQQRNRGTASPLHVQN